MNDLDKLRVMLPHWIDHNQGHGKEFAQWVDKLSSDSPEVAQLLAEAVQSLQKAQNSLEEALEKAGGSLDAPGGGHHHH
jgi:ABC-type transporter Mla subunit MlaD